MATSHPRTARLAALFAPLFALATTSGCLEAVQLELDGETEFSTERLRPSLEPYFGSQPGIPELYSDGNLYDPNDGSVSQAGSQRLSELTIADIPGRSLTQLHRSQCFWAFEGDTPAVSYELLFKDIRYDDRIIEETSVCLEVGANDPDTRENYRGAPVPEGVAIVGFDVSLLGFESQGSDPENPCEIPIDVDGDGRSDAGDPAFDPFAGNVTTFPMANATPLGRANLSFLPVCAIRAAVPPVRTDTSYLLETETANVGELLVVTPEGNEVRRAGGGTMVEHPKLLEPRIKVVKRSTGPGDVFSIARPLRYDSEFPELVDDGTVYRQLWRWAVPVGRDGVWHENFSSLLAVNRVRAFQYGEDEDSNGDFERIYLDPSRIRAYRGDELVPDHQLLRCDTEREGGEGEPRSCLDVFGFTPTYAHAEPSQWITWVVQFRRVTRDRPCLPSEGPGICSDVVEDDTVDPSEPIFIEFDMVGPEFGSQGSALVVAPPTGGAFGNVVMSERPELVNAFTLANLGRASVTVEDVWIDGRDAHVFGFQLASGQVPPFVLPGDSFVQISLQARAETWGEKRARLEILARDVFGTTSRLNVPISANAIDYVVDILPTGIWLTRDSQGYAVESDYVRSLLVANAGALAMPRGKIEVHGPNPEAFSVVVAERRTSDPWAAPYEPSLNGEPPADYAEIRPGTHEWLLVVYHPQDTWRAAGSPPDVAEIHVPIGDQVHVTPVQAMCDGACWFEPPRPASTAGGSAGGAGTSPPVARASR